ncbi:MAG: hypothetical protein AB1403_00500 [Candidatus Riflebacteria bacterium]
MRILSRTENSVVGPVLEKIVACLKEYEKGHFSTTEDLLICMDEEDYLILKNTVEKLRAG